MSRNAPGVTCEKKAAEETMFTHAFYIVVQSIADVAIICPSASWSMLCSFVINHFHKNFVSTQPVTTT